MTLLKSLKLWLSESIGVDRAIAYSVAGKTWSLSAGLITIIFISNYATRLEQGYFYTFQSLLAFQVLFDLGLASIISQFAAHEMAKLQWCGDGTVTGDGICKSRLASIIYILIRWYSVAAILMGVLITAGGWVFFLRNDPINAEIDWRAPWIVLSIAASISITLTPLLGVLEGSGKIVEVATVRFVQEILGFTILWLALVADFGLFALPMMFCSRITVQLLYLTLCRKKFFTDLISLQTEHKVDYKKEVFPFQWRFVVSSLSSLIAYSMIVPIVFSIKGPVASGQLGMTLSITNALVTICAVWINTKIPLFCKLIAQNNYESLNKLFRKAATQSLGLLVTLSVLIIVFAFILNLFLEEYAIRIVEPVALVTLVAAAIAGFPNIACSAYLRAHKKEVTLWANAVTASISIIFVYMSANQPGLTYLAVVQLISAGCLSIWVYRLYIIYGVAWQK
jgi:O-antigen/teichoic acid export membrane protein